MIVWLRQHASHPDLAPGQRYAVIGIEAEDYPLLDDHGQPYLYPYELFDVQDASRPAGWVLKTGQESATYAYPPALGGVGFFEDCFDGRDEAVRAFWQTVNRTLAAA
jgi:hypothetical protein